MDEVRPEKKKIYLALVIHLYNNYAFFRMLTDNFHKDKVVFFKMCSKT